MTLAVSLHGLTAWEDLSCLVPGLEELLLVGRTNEHCEGLGGGKPCGCVYTPPSPDSSPGLRRGRGLVFSGCERSCSVKGEALTCLTCTTRAVVSERWEHWGWGSGLPPLPAHTVVMIIFVIQGGWQKLTSSIRRWKETEFEYGASPSTSPPPPLPPPLPDTQTNDGDNHFVRSQGGSTAG